MQFPAFRSLRLSYYERGAKVRYPANPADKAGTLIGRLFARALLCLPQFIMNSSIVNHMKGWDYHM